MSDPLSVTASVLAVAGAALGCSKAIYSFISTLIDAPEALKNLATELEALNNTLEQLQNVLNERDPYTLSESQKLTLKKTKNLLGQCEKACTDFQAELKKVMSHMNQDGKKSFRDAFKKWFKESKITDFKSKLDSWKVTLGLELQFVTMQVLPRGCQHTIPSLIHTTSKSLSESSDAIKKLDEQFQIAMPPLSESLKEVDQRILELTASFNALKFLDDEVRQSSEAGLNAQAEAAKEHKLMLKHCIDLCEEVTNSVTKRTGHKFIRNKAYNDAHLLLGDVGEVSAGARSHTMIDTEARDRSTVVGGNMDGKSFNTFMNSRSGLNGRENDLETNEEEEKMEQVHPASFYSEDYS